MANLTALFKSQSVHWATPKALYETLNTEFEFDFDPCPLGGGRTGWISHFVCILEREAGLLQPALWPGPGQVAQARSGG